MTTDVLARARWKERSAMCRPFCFVDAAIAAVEHCLPLSFSPALAQGIAGNVFTLQFASPKQ
ncbi:MAG: hypothetical protein E5W72_18185 [Mesorhizobium sp.]|nr:MAG: hypothetical protein E5W72_18185 [Mesorhizobium sp.]